ncbi:hypothetical protein Ancab_012258 [Ancistrocladus abbreviatus]
MANRCCAIELEPKTLNQGQISYAREEAVGIFQKVKPTEASTTLVQISIAGCPWPTCMCICMQEMRQIGSLEGIKEAAEMNDQLHPEKVRGCENTATNAERLPHCSCMQPVIESPDNSTTGREPLTAPF